MDVSAVQEALEKAVTHQTKISMKEGQKRMRQEQEEEQREQLEEERDRMVHGDEQEQLEEERRLVEERLVRYTQYQQDGFYLSHCL